MDTTQAAQHATRAVERTCSEDAPNVLLVKTEWRKAEVAAFAARLGAHGFTSLGADDNVLVFGNRPVRWQDQRTISIKVAAAVLCAGAA